MRIRFLEEKDVAHAARIVGRNYSVEYETSSAAELGEMFGNGTIRPTYVVADEEETIIGLAGFMQSWMDYSIWNIF